MGVKRNAIYQLIYRGKLKATALLLALHESVVKILRMF